MKKNAKKYLSVAVTLSLGLLSMQTYAQMQSAANLQTTQTHAVDQTKHHSSHFHTLDAANYATLQKEPSAVVLVKADWCSTCKSQLKSLETLKKDARYQKVKFFMVDYDQQKSLLKSMKVQTQATVIALKKGQETARVVAQDSATELKKLLDKSL